MKDICPTCRVVLIQKKYLNKEKLTCPSCGFIDRRQGNTMIEPRFDRREIGQISTNWNRVTRY
jgi:Zn-finger nucleic acid-binding protein